MADSVSDLSPEEQQRFNALVLKAKKYAGEGKVQLALDLNLQAFKIYASEKLGKRIQKMKTYLAEYGDDSDEADGDSMVHMGNGFYLFQELYKQLYAHQREGVTWMWWLFQKRKGGILGDDMGLGKTIQVIAFLSGMFDSEKIKSVLIILPVAVITNWENEFQKWAPGISTEHFHSGSKRDRDRALMKVQRRGGVCMTSYGMMVNNADQLAEQNGREFIWDYVILDEGHKIKNPSNKCSKGIHSVPARNRLLLTGTPVQNNLKEMWALFDWTHQGSLLGTSRTFKMEYEMPITRAREKDASGNEQILGEQMAQSLQKIISPYFLRRTKAEVKISEAQRKEKEEKKEDEEGKDEKGIAPSMPTMTHKNDFIVWVYLSEIQQKIYHDFLESDEVKELLNSKRSPLVSLTILKKICDHPRLLTNRQCLQLGITDDDSLDTMDEETGNQIAANRVMHIDNELLVRESGKMVFLIELLDNLKAEGHRALVFSQSRKVLDIIQKVMTDRGHRVARLDGTVRHLMERDEIIQRFKDNRSYSIFLLTTQVGGVGLTLTAADRVVIYDPSWNPATDAQAVDRAFRIGQDKDVVIYRLITCGSVEEKIYRRQVFKDSITRQTVGESKNPFRYFSRQELKELFVLDNPRESSTQQQLEELHRGQRKPDTSLDAHIAFLHSLDMYGLSDHDLMFSREAQNDAGDDATMGTGYIEDRVAKAQQMLGLESEENRLQGEQGQYKSSDVFKEPRLDMPRLPAGSLPHPHPNAYQETPPVNDSYDSADSDEMLSQTIQSIVISEDEGNAQSGDEDSFHDALGPVKSEPSDVDCKPDINKLKAETPTRTFNNDSHSIIDLSTPQEINREPFIRDSPQIPSVNREIELPFSSPHRAAPTPMSAIHRRKSVNLGMTPTKRQDPGCDEQKVFVEPLNFSPMKHDTSYEDSPLQTGHTRKRVKRIILDEEEEEEELVISEDEDLPAYNINGSADQDTSASHEGNAPHVMVEESIEDMSHMTAESRGEHSMMLIEESLEVSNMSHDVLNDVSHDVSNDNCNDSSDSNDISHDVSHDVSHDISHDMSHDISNDVSHNISHDVSHDVSHDMSHISHDVSHDVSHDMNHVSNMSHEISKVSHAVSDQSGSVHDSRDESNQLEETEEEEEEEEELTEEEHNRYLSLLEASKVKKKEGRIEEALALVLEAMEISSQDERVQQWALKLQRKLASAAAL